MTLDCDTPVIAPPGDVPRGGGGGAPRGAVSRRIALLAALALVALAPGWRDSPPAPVPLRVTVSAHGVATGVAMGDGRVLTVAHVLDGARSVRVDGRPARVVRVDRRLDLAELAVPGVAAQPLRTADAGDDAVLHVFRAGRAVALATRVRRRVTASIGGHSRPALELAAVVEPGDSGAPVVDARGRVLGIVFARGSRGAWAVAVSSG
ncbi:trypsin-like peptidase domain-containing protein [Solirubrobacter taibaiensis]|nr:trypsin-like peptidase domain-containing protein [Solirubrobacter taibaiensis]